MDEEEGEEEEGNLVAVLVRVVEAGVVVLDAV